MARLSGITQLFHRCAGVYKLVISRCIRLVTLHLSSLEYADDQILFTLSADGLQEMLNYIIATAAPFGLRLSPAKCELICFHRPGTVNKALLPVVRIGDKTLDWKSSVVYLGSRVAEDGNTLVALKHRIGVPKLL